MIHHVFANRSNIGDWLSARGIQALLGSPVAEHLCDEPFVAETIRALSGCGPGDFVVIGGGGLFMEYFAPFWQGFDPLSRRLRFAIWGVGYCDLKREPSHAPADLLAGIVARSRLCVVRDELSRRLLGVRGLPDPVSCPALSAIEPAPPGFGVLHIDNYDTVGAPTYEVMDAAGQAFADRTGRPFRSTNNRIPPGHAGELARVLGLYAAADLVLSSALHGCVIAVAMGRRVLAVSGDRKIEAFMQAAGFGDWVLDAEPGAPVERELARLHEQAPADGFVRRAREANRAVADRLRQEIEGSCAP